MKENNLFKIIFSSSAAVYNDNQSLQLKESSETGITKNSYGRSKDSI